MSGYDARSGSRRRRLPGKGVLGPALALLRLWSDRRRQRIALAELPARLLADIGVALDEAAREADKPFWR